MMRLWILSLMMPSTLIGEVTYNRDIRPILSDKCFFCHGPDEENNKAGLRLDIAERAYAKLKESPGHGIVPGDVKNSAIWHRIIETDPDDIMPPPESNLTLTDQEKQLIKEWISSGAEYQKHWAFEKLPEQIPVPTVKKQDWPTQPLDHFILARLEKESLTPSPPSPPLRWLRRVTLDLTGLPPTLEEIAAFEKSPDRKAAVDRLLSSPAYGEHIALAWLDTARYADSYGYQSDKLNNQWPYRDWVIQAFNKNLPYDQFLTEQLAGDLLPNSTRNQKLATAFNRIHRVNNEGGAIFEEWRNENVSDRVHTFGTAVLGLTMECCRCHDHKYDPISMKDYYSLSAFFNSIDENGMYDRTEKVPSPSILLPTPEQEAAYHSARATMLEAEKNQPTPRPLVKEDLLADIDFNGSPSQAWFFAQEDRSKAKPLSYVDDALKLNGDRGVLVKNITPFDRWTPFTVSIDLQQSRHREHRAVLAHHCRGTDAGFNGWDLVLENGFVETRLYRVWPGNAIGIRSTKKLPLNSWNKLSATYDGSSKAQGLKLYLDGRELPVTILRDEMLKRVSVKVQHGGEFVLGYRWRDRGVTDALIDHLKIYSHALSATDLIEPVFAPGPAPANTLQEARKSFVMAEEVMNEIPVMKAPPQERPTHILARGEYDAPTSQDTLVKKDTFTNIGPAFSKNAPRNRLGLIQWALDPTHPLTARVFVNRLWSQFFGQGLVKTPENFGLQGALPSHPHLLDWLARDFISHDWDIKRLVRNMVLSSTYSQDSSGSRSIDPENFLLSRGPAYRLGAEQIRDLALASSGLLNRKQGGPPVSPYQPGKDLWQESNGMSPPYQQSTGRELYRRSIYSVWKRTAPLPNMMAFDATTREVCAVDRSRTNTPMQALVLLNDIQFVEAARALAQRTMTTEDDHSKQIQLAFQALTGRSPVAQEFKILTQLYQSQRDHYAAKPAEAKRLISQGESPASKEISLTELAALTTACQAILNLDSTIWKR